MKAHRARRGIAIGIGALLLVVTSSAVLAAKKGKPGDFRKAPATPEEIGDETAWGSRVITARLDDEPGLDLAVVDSGTGIAVLSGRGNGNFTRIDTEVVGDAPIEITAADLDGENGLDLAVARNAFSDSVTVLLNDGTGDFEEADTSPEAGAGGGITSADFDGDEDIDLAVGTGDNPGEGSVFLNDGSGDFAAADTYFGSSVELVESADFDDDGDFDVVELAGAGESASVLLNDGEGNFGDPIGAGQTDGSNAYSLAVGRIGRGSSPDIVLGSNTGIWVFLNDGDGEFAPSPHSPLRRGRAFGGLRVTDVDHDGRGDIVAGESSEDGDRVAVFLSSRRGRFQEPRTSPERIAQGTYLPWIATGQFDGRRGTDVAAAIQGALTILLNRSPAR
jgi:FG-GAP-like repeat